MKVILKWAKGVWLAICGKQDTAKPKVHLTVGANGQVEAVEG